MIARIRRGEPAYHMEAQRRRPDGPLVELLAPVTPWHVDGRLVGVTSTSLDITERARVEQATASLAAIIASSDDAIPGASVSPRDREPSTAMRARAEQRQATLARRGLPRRARRRARVA